MNYATSKCQLMRCSDNPSPCDTRSQRCLQNGDTPYVCTCAPEYYVYINTTSMLRCKRDTCKYLSPKNPCGSDGSCNSYEDAPSGYLCQCRSGYFFNGTTCVVNPCTATLCGQPGIGVCQPSSAGPPYYVCKCKTGFESDGTTCVPAVCTGVNCGSGKCVPKNGKPTCQCDQGAELNEKGICVVPTCKDPRFNKCDANAECTPIDAYRVSCACKAGYRDVRGRSASPSGLNCVVQKCTDATQPYLYDAPCPPTYECKQADPTKSLSCSCPFGTEEINIGSQKEPQLRCFPVDVCKRRTECSVLNRICNKEYRCGPGGTPPCTLTYNCKCKDGYYSPWQNAQLSVNDILQEGVLSKQQACYVADSCKNDSATGAVIPNGNGNCPANKKCRANPVPGQGHYCCPDGVHCLS
eukprot:TRINITY_DN5348_c0_g1_i4.p1 TRINITY_DN5348_c0_g1~~TRINITY_DN5348_c0_g1_i4.p1  ORF type:complete len:426 (-),score=40.26 TRINITY_DN5348_c0_g1_i4:39-1265(-)